MSRTADYNEAKLKLSNAKYDLRELYKSIDEYVAIETDPALAKKAKDLKWFANQNLNQLESNVTELGVRLKRVVGTADRQGKSVAYWRGKFDYTWRQVKKDKDDIDKKWMVEFPRIVLGKGGAFTLRSKEQLLKELDNDWKQVEQYRGAAKQYRLKFIKAYNEINVLGKNLTPKWIWKKKDGWRKEVDEEYGSVLGAYSVCESKYKWAKSFSRPRFIAAGKHVMNAYKRKVNSAKNRLAAVYKRITGQTFMQKLSKITKRVALAPARLIVSVAIRWNIKNLAKKFDKQRTENPEIFNQMVFKWERVSGKRENLEKYINIGKDKPVRGGDNTYNSFDSYNYTTNEVDDATDSAANLLADEDFDSDVNKDITPKQVANEVELITNAVNQQFGGIQDDKKAAVSAIGTAVGGLVVAIKPETTPWVGAGVAVLTSILMLLPKSELDDIASTVTPDELKRGRGLFGMPTWAWWVIGGVTVVGAGIGIYYATRKKK